MFKLLWFINNGGDLEYLAASDEKPIDATKKVDGVLLTKYKNNV